MGSPPHTRGIFILIEFTMLFYGLTPAYAGNIFAPPQISVIVRAHPRIRGEYYDEDNAPHIFTGSPPHTRGIFFKFRLCVILTGLTPAYAGNIIDGCGEDRAAVTHPRIRGEYQDEAD